MRTQQNWWRHQQRLLELWEIILAGARALNLTVVGGSPQAGLYQYRLWAVMGSCSGKKNPGGDQKGDWKGWGCSSRFEV